MIMKRILAIFLAAALLTGMLAGCGKKAESGSRSAAAAAETGSKGAEAASALSSKYVYTAQYLDLPQSMNNVSTAAVSGGKLYYAGSVVSGKDTYTDGVSGENYDYDTYVTKLFCMDLETRQSQELSGFTPMEIPEGMQGDASIQKIIAAADGTIWVFEQLYTYTYNLPEDFDASTDDQWNYYQEGESKTRLVHLDAEGKTLKDIELSADDSSSASSSGGAQASGFLVDDSGNIYTTDYQNIFVYDSEGKLLFQLSASQNGGDLRQYSGTQIGVITWSGDSMALKVIDPKTKGWGETIELPQNAYTFFPGDDAYDLYYDYNGCIYGYSKATDTSEKVVDWLACDIDGNNVQSYQMLPDGRVVAIYCDYSSSGAADAGELTGAAGSGAGSSSGSGCQIVVLTRTNADEVTPKTELTLACMYLDSNLRSQIVKFNRSSDKYRIVVRDYSEYNTDKDYNAGLTKLSTEILSGQIPDILSTNQLPVDQFAAKGLLEDLYTYIDADGELTRDSFIPSVLKALSIDGKLYQITTSFGVTTAAGLTKAVGGYDAWTFDSLKDALARLPEGAMVFNVDTTKAQALSDCLSRSFESFVDWNAKTCSFNTPEFISLLEFANQFPETFDYKTFSWDTDYHSNESRVRAGQQLLATLYLNDFQSFQFEVEAMGDGVSFVGFPTTDGTNTSSFQVSSGLAITTSCADKQGAWSFIRSLLTKDAQMGSDMWNFPVNADAFEALARTAMTPDYQKDADGNYVLDDKGNKIENSKGGYGNQDTNIELYAMTQAEYDQLKSIIASTSSVYVYDDEIMKIVTDETAAYFAGEKDAQSAADMIQSRVSLYVQEQG